MACCGDIPTLETLAAVALLREHLPDLKVRVVNVVDLMRLQPDTRASARHVRRASSTRCSRIDKPVIFAYHGYPWLIHRLTYRRTNHANLHVRGYKEEGTTTTPFDMVMLNDLDRFHLVIDVDRPRAGPRRPRRATCASSMVERRLAARAYTRAHGDDDPDDPRLDVALLSVGGAAEGADDREPQAARQPRASRLIAGLPLTGS